MVVSMDAWKASSMAVRWVEYLVVSWVVATAHLKVDNWVASTVGLCFTAVCVSECVWSHI